MAHGIDARCVGCSACIAHCPLEAIRPADPCFVILAEACTDCGVCVPSCPTDAIQDA
jgi:Na+-translocating ferredoxin:NAD+ oxidoreductase RNF subunit RnfB